MEEHKIEVIFRFSVVDLVEILSDCLLAISYTFCHRMSFSFDLPMSSLFMRTALAAGWPCDLRVAGMTMRGLAVYCFRTSNKLRFISKSIIFVYN